MLGLACDPQSGEQTGIEMHRTLKTAWELYGFLEEFFVGVVADNSANITSAGRHYCDAHNPELITKLAFNVLGGQS